ncbi:MAG: hypothetical protein K8T89_13260, partial [Planctomycetes bacterium]|nr:hypothetical protein [Planctomycetota bacterium]
ALNTILQLLLGLPCLKMEFTYCDELYIHFGLPVPYRHPRLKDEMKGSWILGSRGSKWKFSVGEPPRLVSSEILTADAILRAEELFQRLAGSQVLEVIASPHAIPTESEPGISLLVQFRDGSTLSIVPTADPDQTGLADWELFTPFGMYLTCGPGQTWSFLRSESDKVGLGRPSHEEVPSHIEFPLV